MKLNKKGFMLAEVVVSASVVAVILVTLYIGVSRMTNAYGKRNRYYDLDAQQVAMEVNDIILRDSSSITGYGILDDYEDFYENLKDNFNYNDINVYYSSYQENNLNNLININTNIEEYIEYIKDKTDFTEDYSYFIVVELKKSDDYYYYYTLKVR